MSLAMFLCLVETSPPQPISKPIPMPVFSFPPFWMPGKVTSYCVFVNRFLLNISGVSEEISIQGEMSKSSLKKKKTSANEKGFIIWVFQDK